MGSGTFDGEGMAARKWVMIGDLILFECQGHSLQSLVRRKVTPRRR
jgi:predicted Zn-dependent protease